MSLDFNNGFTSTDYTPGQPVVPSSRKMMPQTEQAVEPKEESFAEVALRLGGASEEEAKRTGAVDTADDQVEALFADRYKTTHSPIHRAVWDREVASEVFETRRFTENEEVSQVIERSLEIVKRHRDHGSLVDKDGKIANEVLVDLGDAGYWGLLVDEEYGGSGASMQQFAKMITRMAIIDPTVAGLASVHGCIGAVDPVRTFGTTEQKQRFLPMLADGTKLSAFALTEPGAGSDLTALKTIAVRDGSDFLVSGEKLFITNAVLGRTIGLVCKIEGVPSVLVVDLPEQETESFKLNRYGIYALRRAHNNGLIFRNFRVPAINRLVPHRGDGLTIAYHGLNLGRIALCANAAGTMRLMLSEMLPWAAYRETYGQAIANRELVRRRIGRMAGLIVACDAMTQWCAGLIDEGYRGEMECVIAKIFGSESQKEAAIELFMKTHGGRSFLKGHLFGDNVHEFLAPCIYEGEGEMLSMAFFKSLVKHHGQTFFEPIGRTLNELGVTKPRFTKPSHWWALRKPMTSYASWYASRRFSGTRWSALPPLSIELRRHTRFAQKQLSKAAIEISGTMRSHQLKLADRQCRMSAISRDLQDAVVMLVTSLYATKCDDPTTRSAADTVCRELRRRITGQPITDDDFRQVTKLGMEIAESNDRATRGWSELAEASPSQVMMPYKHEVQK